MKETTDNCQIRLPYGHDGLVSFHMNLLPQSDAPPGSIWASSLSYTLRARAVEWLHEHMPDQYSWDSTSGTITFEDAALAIQFKLALM